MNSDRKEYFKEYYQKKTKNKMLNVKLTELDKINNKLDNIFNMLNVKLTNSTMLNVDSTSKKEFNKEQEKQDKNGNKIISSENKKRITIMVDRKIIDMIEGLKVSFNVFFNNSLLFFRENNCKLEPYSITSKVRKDVRLAHELDNIYKTLPEKNKMCFVNDLLLRYKKKGEK